MVCGNSVNDPRQVEDPDIAYTPGPLGAPVADIPGMATVPDILPSAWKYLASTDPLTPFVVNPDPSDVVMCPDAAIEVTPVIDPEATIDPAPVIFPPVTLK